MAKLYFRYGAMNSGKTTALMQVAYNYKERGMRVLILKPAIDTKGQDSILSRLGISCKVDKLVTPDMDVVELVRADEAAHGKIACVLCDESQFFTPEQADQLFLVTVDLGIPVICYGLRADFMMRGFPGSTRLLEIAHTIEELKTICACGRKAICNGRKVNGEYVFEGAQVAIDTVDDIAHADADVGRLCPVQLIQVKVAHAQIGRKRLGRHGLTAEIAHVYSHIDCIGLNITMKLYIPHTHLKMQCIKCKTAG